MTKINNQPSGFSLIELLLYISLMSIMMLAIALFISTLTESRIKNQVITEVEQQGLRVSQIITQKIRNAETIDAPVLGETTTTLSLNNNSISFALNTGALIIQESGQSGPLTSRVVVSDLTFTNFSNPGTTGIINFSFTMAYNNNGSTGQYTNYSKKFWGSATVRRPFNCGSDTVSDSEGNSYNTVKIGTQCWLKENLYSGTFIYSRDNGSHPIRDNGSHPIEQLSNNIKERYCYGYDIELRPPVNPEIGVCNSQGGLYQWGEAVQYLNEANNSSNWDPAPTGNVQGLCPTGWHIPTLAEFEILARLADDNHRCTLSDNTCTTAGARLKSTHWGSGTDDYGFSAFGSGRRDGSGEFSGLETEANFWSASPMPGESSASSIFILSSGDSTAFSWNRGRTMGFSIRCLKD